MLCVFERFLFLFNSTIVVIIYFLIYFAHLNRFVGSWTAGPQYLIGGGVSARAPLCSSVQCVSVSSASVCDCVEVIDCR